MISVWELLLSSRFQIGNPRLAILLGPHGLKASWGSASHQISEARKNTPRRDPVCCGVGRGRTLTNQDGGGGGEGRGGWEVTVVVKAAGVGRQQQSLEGTEQD